MGVTRLVYNLAWEQRRDWWRQHQAQTGRAIDYFTQSREVTALRAEFDWIRAAPCSALHQAIRDLQKAFVAFWRGRAAFPTPRKKGVNESFRLQAKDCSFTEPVGRFAFVKIPNIGRVRFRLTRPIPGLPVNVTVSENALGWHVAIVCEIDDPSVAPAGASIGIDRGIANTLALSNGDFASTDCTASLERRKRKARRILARRVRGSNRYAKQRRRAARIAAKIGRVRADWRHKVTTDIANRFGLVAIEALQVKNMTAAGKGKRGLNRSILEQGWGGFERVLAYKLEERGGTLVKVNPAYTSQECSACGAIDKASRESQASFACRHCGFAAHADTNAAINILRRSTAGVEGRGCAPDEARTGHDRLAA